MKSRRMRGAIPLIVAGLMLAGCGSSGESSAEPNAEVSVPTGDPIVLGFICSCTGPAASSTGTASAIIQAWADSINDEGGLNGHPIKLIVKDDQASPEKALQMVKELVEEDKIVAMVGNVTGADGAFQAYLEEKQVPVVGGFSGEVSYMVSPVFFTSGTPLATTLLGIFTMVKDAGMNKVGELYCAENPICAASVPLAAMSAELTEMEFTSLKVSGSAPNFTAPCLSMQEQGVDSLWPALDTGVYPRVMASCANAGYRPTMAGNSPARSAWADPNLAGAIWPSMNANHFDTSIPSVKAMTDVLEKYAPEVLESDQYTQVSSTAFAGGRLFEAASVAAGGFTPTTTSAEIMDALYMLQDETLDGLAPPLTFVKSEPGAAPALPNCYFTAALEDGKATSTADGEASCVPQEQVTALVDALKAAMSAG